MALRLRDAIDYRRWGRGTRAEWNRFATRREIPRGERPRVVVIRGVASEPTPPAFVPVVTHRSNELVNILKRFTAYSNNDIERFGVSLGSPSQLADYLTRRWNGATTAIRFETLSGLGTNRMSPRQIVRLMRDFREVTIGIGLRVEDLLPVAGCDPGTMSQFPQLNDGAAARVVAGKTGTLTYTDNGITALAGYMHTVGGERVFCVAAPNSSGRIAAARRAEEGWLLERIDRYGGPQSLNCGLPPWHSDTDARILDPAEAARRSYLPGHSAMTAGSIPLLP
jgi:D-alanyl-D-alanine carboxypeptidase